MEQHLPAADREWQVAQLVEDDEIDADKLVGQLSRLAGARLGLELVDQIDGSEEAHAGAAAHAIGADRDGDMALAGAARGSAILPGFRRLKFGSSIRFTRAAAKSLPSLA
jgi:hypothetical protein